MTVSAREVRRLTMTPHDFRVHLNVSTISYLGLYLAAPEGSGKVGDLLRAKETLEELIKEAVAEKMADMGNVR